MFRQALTPSEDTEFLDTIILETWEGEAIEVFNEADKEAGEEVQVTICTDTNTGENLELDRDDWI